MKLFLTFLFTKVDIQKNGERHARLLELARVMGMDHHLNEKDLNEQEISIFRQTLFSCLLYTSPSPRDQRGSRMPSSA